MEKADGRSNTVTSVRPSVVTLAKFFLNQIPQVQELTIHAPAIDRIDKIQVLYAAVASWAGELKQEVAEDRRTHSILTERVNGAQAERDLVRQKYELSVSPHPALAELMEAMDTRVKSAKTDAARAREHASNVMDEWRNFNQVWRSSLDSMQAKVDKKRDNLKALRARYHLLTTPEEPTARDLVKCLVMQNSITDIRAEEAEKRVQERDERLRQAQDDLRQTKEELREELLAKDAKLRDLQKTLREQSGEVQSEQLESARKEFHDVEQRFALVESPDLSDTSLPSFLPVLVETVRNTLDAEFDLMRQLQSVQLATPGATTSATRE
ncbi:hypothetical protein R1flu_007648 [Riccia fluitans]|uniref:Uncharacterized protein n=1 Tax=Riccia fluitans TaxID=41844 RepID=A0ABD1YZG4_9MARC